MNNEIEQLLIQLEYFIEENYKYYNDFELNKNQIKQLLDYITNLQQKIEQYENPDDMTLFYMWLDVKAKDKIKDLQQENENIKEKAKNYLDIYEEMFDYKSRCEKAVEEINYWGIDKEHNDDSAMRCALNNLLNILQNGSEKDDR